MYSFPGFIYIYIYSNTIKPVFPQWATSSSSPSYYSICFAPLVKWSDSKPELCLEFEGHAMLETFLDRLGHQLNEVGMNCRCLCILAYTLVFRGEELHLWPVWPNLQTEETPFRSPDETFRGQASTVSLDDIICHLRKKQLTFELYLESYSSFSSETGCRC